MTFSTISTAVLFSLAACLVPVTLSDVVQLTSIQSTYIATPSPPPTDTPTVIQLILHGRVMARGPGGHGGCTVHVPGEKFRVVLNPGYSETLTETDSEGRLNVEIKLNKEIYQSHSADDGEISSTSSVVSLCEAPATSLPGRSASGDSAPNRSANSDTYNSTPESSALSPNASTTSRPSSLGPSVPPTPDLSQCLNATISSRDLQRLITVEDNCHPKRYNYEVITLIRVKYLLDLEWCLDSAHRDGRHLEAGSTYPAPAVDGSDILSLVMGDSLKEAGEGEGQREVTSGNSSLDPHESWMKDMGTQMVQYVVFETSLKNNLLLTGREHPDVAADNAVRFEATAEKNGGGGGGEETLKKRGERRGRLRKRRNARRYRRAEDERVRSDSGESNWLKNDGDKRLWGDAGESAWLKRDDDKRMWGDADESAWLKRDDDQRMWGDGRESAWLKVDNDKRMWGDEGESAWLKRDDDKRMWGDAGESAWLKRDDEKRIWGDAGESAWLKRDDDKRMWGDAGESAWLKRNDDDKRMWGDAGESAWLKRALDSESLEKMKALKPNNVDDDTELNNLKINNFRDLGMAWLKKGARKTKTK